MSPCHLITGEYPPQPGGVSDYTQLVASGLAAKGVAVHVWCPPVDVQEKEWSGVTVHREMGRFSPADLRRVNQLLEQFPPPRRLLVQWVPHAFGYQSINLPFCLWLRRRAKRHHDHVELIVHEPCLGFAGSWKQLAAAAVHRVMVTVLLQAASRVWVVTPAWESCLRPFTFGRRVSFSFLPVPSNIPVAQDASSVAKIKRRLTVSNNGGLVGHFGTYSELITAMLEPPLAELLNTNPSCSLLLLGRNSESMHARLVESDPRRASRIHARCGLPARELSLHLQACDVMLQPYPGGVCSRRTSIMAALAHGLPVVTNAGQFTEPIWNHGAPVIVADESPPLLLAGVQYLLQDSIRRRQLGERGRALYDERFDIRHLVDAILGVGCWQPSSSSSEQAAA